MHECHFKPSLQYFKVSNLSLVAVIHIDIALSLNESKCVLLKQMVVLK